MNPRCDVKKRWELHEKMIKTFITDDDVVLRKCYCKSCSKLAIVNTTKKNTTKFICTNCSWREYEDSLKMKITDIEYDCWCIIS